MRTRTYPHLDALRKIALAWLLTTTPAFADGATLLRDDDVDHLDRMWWLLPEPEAREVWSAARDEGGRRVRATVYISGGSSPHDREEIALTTLAAKVAKRGFSCAVAVHVDHHRGWTDLYAVAVRDEWPSASACHPMTRIP